MGPKTVALKAQVTENKRPPNKNKVMKAIRLLDIRLPPPHIVFWIQNGKPFSRIDRYIVIENYRPGIVFEWILTRKNFRSIEKFVVFTILYNSL
jgi:hypothetical protein